MTRRLINGVKRKREIKGWTGQNVEGKRSKKKGAGEWRRKKQDYSEEASIRKRWEKGWSASDSLSSAFSTRKVFRLFHDATAYFWKPVSHLLQELYWRDQRTESQTGTESWNSKELLEILLQGNGLLIVISTFSVFFLFLFRHHENCQRKKLELLNNKFCSSLEDRYLKARRFPFS